MGNGGFSVKSILILRLKYRPQLNPIAIGMRSQNRLRSIKESYSPIRINSYGIAIG